VSAAGSGSAGSADGRGGPLLRHSIGWRDQLRAALRPILAYHLTLVWAFVCFVTVVLLSEGGGQDHLLFLTVTGSTSVVGVLLGQAAALAGIRTWLLVLFGGACWIMGFATSVAGRGSDVATIAFMLLFMLPIAMTGGAWSLATNRALFSAWLPLMYATAAVIVWADFTDADDAWFRGDKWAIWDAPELLILGGTLALFLLFLAARESHRLALWQRGPTAPLQPSLAEKGQARPRLTLLGYLMLGALALTLTFGTAVVSPYLWRTGEGGDNPDDAVPREQTEADAPEEEEPGDMSWLEGVGRALQQALDAAQEASGALCSVLTVLLLLLAGWLSGWRPVRRLVLLRHLRDPLWPVSPTQRIENGWRLVEIALGDAGVVARPGEDAASLARRARPVLEALSPVEVHGLEDAAAVADRVRFGLGVQPGDVDTMVRFSRWTADTVWERLGDRRQVGAIYRALD
jgi:hypothetical protein